MNMLAFDAATPICSIALASEAKRWYVEIDAGQRHSESFMNAADMLMRLAGLRPADLDAVACMKGPGSFTGLRIGFSAAKGICFALGIPFLTVPTLDCAAFSRFDAPGLTVPVIDAKQRRYFTALYRGPDRLTEYLDADARRIADALREAAGDEPITLTGLDAEPLYAELRKILEPAAGNRLRLDPSRRKGCAAALLALAQRKLAAGAEDSAAESGPVYLRKSDAEERREFS